MKKSVLLLLLVSGLFLGWLFSNANWETVEVESGLTAEAKKDMWLAAADFVALHGKSMQKEVAVTALSKQLSEHNPADVVVILNEDVFRLQPDIARDLVQWSQKGGHIIYELSSLQRDDVADNSLLSMLPIAVYDDDFYYNRYNETALRFFVDTSPVFFSNQEFQAAFPYDSRIYQCRGTQIYSARQFDEKVNDNVYNLCQFKSGQGKVTVVTSAAFMRNALLDKFQNALLLLELTGKATKLIQVADPESQHWLTKLWLWNWQGWILLLLAVSLLLWRSAQRMSPAEPYQQSSQAPFRLHLRALGQYFFAGADGGELKQQLMQDLWFRCERRFPGFQRMSKTEQYQKIATQAGLTQQQLDQFLARDWPVQVTERLEYLIFWQKLRKAI